MKANDFIKVPRKVYEGLVKKAMQISNFRRTKFNSTYCGDRILIGFTGSSTDIMEYVNDVFKGKVNKKIQRLEKEKYNLTKDGIVLHIETYPVWQTDEEDIIKDLQERK